MSGTRGTPLPQILAPFSIVTIVRMETGYPWCPSSLQSTCLASRITCGSSLLFSLHPCPKLLPASLSHITLLAIHSLVSLFCLPSLPHLSWPSLSLLLLSCSPSLSLLMATSSLLSMFNLLLSLCALDPSRCLWLFFPCIYNKNLPLNHALEQSRPQFIHLMLKPCLYIWDKNDNYEVMYWLIS